MGGHQQSSLLLIKVFPFCRSHYPRSRQDHIIQDHTDQNHITSPSSICTVFARMSVQSRALQVFCRLSILSVKKPTMYFISVHWKFQCSIKCFDVIIKCTPWVVLYSTPKLPLLKLNWSQQPDGGELDSSSTLLLPLELISPSLECFNWHWLGVPEMRDMSSWTFHHHHQQQQ